MQQAKKPTIIILGAGRFFAYDENDQPVPAVMVQLEMNWGHPAKAKVWPADLSQAPIDWEDVDVLARKAD